MARKMWTNKELDYLKEHYGTVPAREIASVLERSEKSVVMAANRYKLDNKSYRQASKVDHKQIAMLIAQGKTVTQIAKIVDMHAQTIYWHIRSMPQWVRDKSAKNGRKSSAKASQARMIKRYHGEAA